MSFIKADRRRSFTTRVVCVQMKRTTWRTMTTVLCHTLQLVPPPCPRRRHPRHHLAATRGLQVYINRLNPHTLIFHRCHLALPAIAPRLTRHHLAHLNSTGTTPATHRAVSIWKVRPRATVAGAQQSTRARAATVLPYHPQRKPRVPRE